MEKRVEAEEVAAQEMSITVDSVSDDRKYSSPPRAHFSSLTKLAHHRLLNFPKPTVSLAKKAGAEFVGTFVIIFAAAAASIVNKKYGGVETLIGGAGASGLAVMVMVVATGHISGAHLNPAVTLSFATFGHLPWAQVPAYFGAQVTASISAGFLLKGVYHPFLHGGVTVPSVAYWQAFLLELLISFNLMFVITAVATDNRAPRQMAGIAVGTTVMVNILIAGFVASALHLLPDYISIPCPNIRDRDSEYRQWPVRSVIFFVAIFLEHDIILKNLIIYIYSLQFFL
ncbi:probable aquaporin NIP5-1 isoform X1 [Nymphaea colorata]|nr:probable aquaporin NIP5-1 isoform X1 [Nymphaea colorata]